MDEFSSQRSGSQWVGRQWLGLCGGPLLALLCFAILPEQFQNAVGETTDFTMAGRATLAMLIWMAVWWLTEAIPIYATALLPLTSFPILGVADMNAAASPYANPLIFLFLGGFLLALSMEKSGLGKRIALIVLRSVGSDPTRIIGGFMVTTALLSGFVSNTATVAMMLPIALSVVALVQPNGCDSTEAADVSSLSTCLMLGIAYSGSIGGVMTIIGTPPNVFLVSFLQDGIAAPFRMDLSFVRYLMIGVPFAMVMLPITWLMLTKVLFPIKIQQLAGVEHLIDREYRSLGSPNRGEWATFLVFIATAVCWILRPWLVSIEFSLAGEPWRPLAGLTDAGIGMTGALTLFVIPTQIQPPRFVMDWETAIKVPWGILVLFGGGLSLASAVTSNGVAEFIASYGVKLEALPDVVIVLLITAAVVFLTELTSNIATTATLVPILAALAPGLGVHPYLLIFPAAIAASCAFMLPVATPPNAIVFGSGKVSIAQMVKAGLGLNLVGIVFITILTMVVIRPLLI